MSGHAACRGWIKINKMWSEDLKECCCLGDVVVDWRIILRSLLRKSAMRMCTGFIRLRIDPVTGSRGTVMNFCVP